MRKTTSLLAVTGLVGAALAAASPAIADNTTGIDLQPESTQQKIDGFGYSAAFQRTALLKQLSPEKKAEAVELLLGDEGVNPSILRLGIGGQSTQPYDWMLSIQPEDPGGPDAEPNYQWDGDDNGQVWFAQEAEKNGVEYIYGDAWTAPGYMKSNDSPQNGGVLCGISGTDCKSGDWTEAYSNYLVAWADFYKQEGVNIDGIAFTNEPDFTSPYESMRFTPAQAAEFTKTFGPIADESGYDVICCESFGWNQGKNYHSAIRGDSEASQWVDVLTAHSYASRSDSPYETDGSIWMSEWAGSATSTFNANWDGETRHQTDGIQMTDHLMDSLTKGNVTGYLWWLGVSQGSSASLMVVDPAADTYTVGARLYGMAAVSRFIRPDAHRVDVVHSIDGLKAAAFENADGSRVVELLNNGENAMSTDIDIATQPVAYLNDQSHHLEESTDIATTADGKTSLELPARSLVTLVIPAEESASDEGLQIEATVPDGTVPGSLVLSIAGSGESVVLDDMTNEGDRLRFVGELPTVTVVDSRNDEQAGSGGWSVSGQSSDFTSGDSVLGADQLGWTPSLREGNDGVTAGATVASSFDGGSGLATPQKLGQANAEGRYGTAAFDTELALDVKVGTEAGTYTGTLSVTLFPED